MSKRFSISALAAALLCTPAVASAAEFHVAGAYSADQLWGMRVGLRSNALEQQLLPNNVLDLIGSPSIYLEGALNQWRDSDNHDDKLNALTLLPIFQWHLAGEQRPLYLEAGIGVALLDDSTISNRDLSIHFQFEDRIGLSWQYGTNSKARVSVVYTHYSQADLDRPNDGLDFFSLNWHYPF
ncbi:acyloxyacyl hydrolase [Pseudidiomarina sediminum]|nr:acyloxyacyl hydrolase [Pseudidiomarina sediminum]